MSDTNIVLGGRVFAVEPLKLGQLRGLLDALDDLSGKTGGAMIDAAARVLLAGLARSTPHLTLDQLLEFEATMAEVSAAVATILATAGLTNVGEALPVAGPAPKPAPNSPASTAPSPPVAAIRLRPSTA